MATAAKMTAAVLGVLALAIGLWYARTAILLAFAGILLAIVLYGASRALAEFTKLPRLLMLAAVVLLVALFFAVVFIAAGPTLTQQVAGLARGIAAGATTLTKELAAFADQANLLQNVDPVQMLSGFLSPWGIATGATSVALSIVGLFSAGLIVLFFGIYFAADPHTYAKLVARLAREAARRHCRDDVRDRRPAAPLADRPGHLHGADRQLHLYRPLNPRRADRLRAGAVRRARRLPALSRTDHRRDSDGAGRRRREFSSRADGLYALIQFLESYLLTPLIQARAVSMPPAAVILSQLVLGAIFGLLGLALATPLVAAATVPLRFLFGIGGKDRASAN
jgi:predicted PurR-regulated permease PerM